MNSFLSEVLLVQSSVVYKYHGVNVIQQIIYVGQDIFNNKRIS